MSTVEVRVPDMGNFESVTVIDVLVKPGDTIDIDTPLATLETDKATMDVPSTAKGVVEKVHITKGGSVSTGSLIVSVKAAAGSAAPAPAKAEAPAAAHSERGGQRPACRVLHALARALGRGVPGLLAGATRGSCL